MNSLFNNWFNSKTETAEVQVPSISAITTENYFDNIPSATTPIVSAVKEECNNEISNTTNISMTPILLDEIDVYIITIDGIPTKICNSSTNISETIAGIATEKMNELLSNKNVINAYKMEIPQCTFIYCRYSYNSYDVICHKIRYDKFTINKNDFI